MAILLLILIFLLGVWVPSDIVADEPVAAPTPVIVDEPPPLPPVVDEDEAVLQGTPPPIPEPNLEEPTPRPPSSAGDAWPVPGVIADVATVEAIRFERTTKIIALTPADEFARGHIRGARQIDWKPFEIVETGDQQVETWRAEVEIILTELGIQETDTVVVYDGGTFYASRLWWVLDQLGHENKLILDGGLPAWEAAGMPVESEGSWVGYAPADPYAGTPDEAVIATIAEVEAALDDPDVVLVDARTPEEYAKGHIPGAVNIPFTDNAAPDSGGRWKSPDELRAMYAAAGVTEDRTVIPYCLTGVRSAATYVTLTALGYPDVSLFTGSWAEWSVDPARPVEM